MDYNNNNNGDFDNKTEMDGTNKGQRKNKGYQYIKVTN